MYYFIVFFQFTWIITFIATILFGVDMGLIVGIFWLLLTLVLQRYLSDVIMLGSVNQSNVYRDVILSNQVGGIFASPV